MERAGEGDAVTIVRSLNVSDILSQAKDSFHVPGNAILEQELKPGWFVQYSDGIVENKSCLVLQPEYCIAQFQLQTLEHTKALRWIAERVANENGKICGRASQVSAICIEVEVRAVDSTVMETFLASMMDAEGFQSVGAIQRSMDYGVLHGSFVVVEHSQYPRTDQEDGFDREQEAPSEASCKFYTWLLVSNCMCRSFTHLCVYSCKYSSLEVGFTAHDLRMHGHQPTGIRDGGLPPQYATTRCGQTKHIDTSIDNNTPCHKNHFLLR